MLWTDLVKVVVGPNKALFVAHSVILVKAPFFQACLRSPLKEKQTGIIELATGCPDAFDSVLMFLYSEECSLEECKRQSFEPSVSASHLAKTYSMAKFLMLEKLENATIDTMVRHQRYPDPKVLNYFHEQNLEDSKMMELVMLYYAKLLREAGPGWMERLPHLTNYVNISKDNANRLMEAMMDTKGPPSTHASACIWHTHDTTPRCEGYSRCFLHCLHRGCRP